MKSLWPFTITAYQMPDFRQSPITTSVLARDVWLDQKFVPGPERKLTLCSGYPCRSETCVATIIGTNASAMTFRT
jgi:hypothetical protein